MPVTSSFEYQTIVSRVKRHLMIWRSLSLLWALAAAVLSSRHERARPRTRERALLNMEDLVRGLDAPNPGAASRARYSFSVWFPPGAQLRKAGRPLHHPNP